MKDISLTDEQAAALHDLLERVLSDLSFEIASTDLKSFRDGIKDQRDQLKAIQDQLE